MAKRPLPLITIRLDKIVTGGQALGTLEDGRKAFVWGGLPGELVEAQVTRKKSSFFEAVVTNVLEASDERTDPVEPDSYLSTSPWQILAPASEQTYKASLIDQAFTLHHVTLPQPSVIYSDERLYGYRNKMEFSWWWDKEAETLDLAFYRRGSHTKMPVQGSELASEPINRVAGALRDVLRARGTIGFQLKTALIRSNAAGQVIAQLYVKDPEFQPLTDDELSRIGSDGFELIFSNPQSPASVITERMQQHGLKALSDTILDVPFTYATEGFFQINLPVYERALKDMREWVETNKPTVDLYSGVGTIGLTIGQENVTLVELNPSAVHEMKANIAALNRKSATAVLAASEKALEYIASNATIIVDPPRAGLDASVTERLLETAPERIIYLSCNPVTQARDVALLLETYDIIAQQGYNFFPRTPHIENLIVLHRR
jgi:23S rRNA (uracil1939-C5)-methyltransferase